jgi:DNA-binding transcriptional MocR family regulator
MINTLAPASPTQMAIAEFLTSGGYERHLRRVRRIYEKQLGQMLEALRRHFPEGTRTPRPEGSFIFWVELPEGVDSLEMFRRAREKGISIAPGPIFSNSGKYRNFLRLNAAHFSPKVERALETLGGLALEQVS